MAHEAQGIIWHSKGRIMLDLPIDEAMDIAMAFPSNDGFVKDICGLVAEAEAYIEGSA